MGGGWNHRERHFQSVLRRPLYWILRPPEQHAVNSQQPLDHLLQTGQTGREACARLGESSTKGLSRTIIYYKIPQYRVIYYSLSDYTTIYNNIQYYTIVYNTMIYSTQYRESRKDRPRDPLACPSQDFCTFGPHPLHEKTIGLGSKFLVDEQMLLAL